MTLYLVCITLIPLEKTALCYEMIRTAGQETTTGSSTGINETLTYVIAIGLLLTDAFHCMSYCTLPTWSV